VAVAAAEAGSAGFRIFVVGSDGALWHRTTRDDDWQSLGALTRDVSVARLPNGGYDAFAVGSDRALWHIRRERRDASKSATFHPS
jgi:hypothetical protein